MYTRNRQYYNDYGGWGEPCVRVFARWWQAFQTDRQTSALIRQVFITHYHLAHRNASPVLTEDARTPKQVPFGGEKASMKKEHLYIKPFITAGAFLLAGIILLAGGVHPERRPKHEPICPGCFRAAVPHCCGSDFCHVWGDGKKIQEPFSGRPVAALCLAKG